MVPRIPAVTFSLVALAVLAAITAGCDDPPTTPTSYAPFSQTDLIVGTGATAGEDSTVTVYYKGWFYDGSKPDQKGAQFDAASSRTAFSFTLGAGQVIEGWDRGVPGMNVGGLRRLVIPPSLAYGGRRNQIIPPNATLVFEIELLNVE